MNYLDYDPKDQPGADEVPDFEEEFKEALRQHYEEEDAIVPEHFHPLAPTVSKDDLEERLMQALWDWNDENRVGC